jgi:hypothetical protein
VFFVAIILAKRQVLLEQDLESTIVEGGEEGFFVGASERDTVLARSYTFGVREMPFLSQYGTIAGADSEFVGVAEFLSLSCAD